MKEDFCFEEKIEKLLDEFTPKIQSSLMNTNWQEREDLEQELKIKIYAKCELFKEIYVPGFIEFLSKE